MKPVAWMGKDYDGLKTDLYFDVERNKLPYRLYETATPLYTHPVKELTDEDLIKIFYEMTALSKLHCEALTKAILRKAQE